MIRIAIQIYYALNLIDPNWQSVESAQIAATMKPRDIAFYTLQFVPTMRLD